jgi:hypothetical protein
VQQRPDLRDDPVMAGLSRRGFVLSAGTAAVCAGFVRRPAAQRQVSQHEALYQDQPKNGLSCAACALFRPPSSCVVVAGVISPSGWCRFFDLPD